MATTVVKKYGIAPYYDDFDETKNYHRILFRPGHAVQARELMKHGLKLKKLEHTTDNVQSFVELNTPLCQLL